MQAGGETAFPFPNVKIEPKRGRAVLWANTLDRNLEEIDNRATHEAKPVVHGIKYAANTWIHLYEYTKPFIWGCTGSFTIDEGVQDIHDEDADENCEYWVDFQHVINLCFS